MEIISRQSYIDHIDHIVRYFGKGMMIALTGQRRVGKSYILRQLASVIAQVNPDANIIYINKENHSFKFSFIDEEERKCVYTDQILLNFRSLPGNSGGLVCYKDKNTNKLMTVGIVGGNCTTSVPPVLSQTVAYCCKQNVIQTVMGLERY